ncbi:hypothetical protein ONZ45_g5418 [Pleurotus djamor]|nr:hypothetical protein ONZ45_g5418 [Pleurotus djamor]
MTVQTGLITSLLTLAVMITVSLSYQYTRIHLASPHLPHPLQFETLTTSYVWVALYMCLARIFSNSLLATLNARTIFRRMAATDNISLRLADAESSPAQIKFAQPNTDVIDSEISDSTTIDQSSLR